MVFRHDLTLVWPQTGPCLRPSGLLNTHSSATTLDTPPVNNLDGFGLPAVPKYMDTQTHTLKIKQLEQKEQTIDNGVQLQNVMQGNSVLQVVGEQGIETNGQLSDMFSMG